MYAACRHIKSNGLRCKSPAMRDNAFCYFHSKVHAITRTGSREEIRIPISDHPIPLAVAQIVNALLAKTIGAKEAGLALYGLQVSSQFFKIESEDPVDIVRNSIELNDGNELALPLCIEDESDTADHDDCTRCAHRRICVDYHPSEADAARDAHEEELLTSGEDDSNDDDDCAGQAGSDEAPDKDNDQAGANECTSSLDQSPGLVASAAAATEARKPPSRDCKGPVLTVEEQGQVGT